MRACNVDTMTTEPEQDEKWYRGDIARHFGINPNSVNSRDFPLPTEDGSEVDRHYVRKWWWKSTILALQRPGRGARTDLAAKRDAE
jgi:hypothetical protein